MNVDTRTKLSTTTILLHWLVGLLVMGMLVVGVYMANFEVYALYPWHKSLGQLVFLIVLVQAIHRLKNGWPPAVSEYSLAERVLARGVHYLLLVGVLLMPVFGFLMSVFGGNGVAFFGLQLVARNPDPVNVGKVIPLNGPLAEVMNAAHGILGYLLILAILLHIAGAFKHHLLDKDGTLRRMLGAKV
ncbi:cytochrome b [Oceanisphaera sp. W20_SRM_FM3]|uniref:cytochrome b n=1 Tax=Oceanisphaera sp. W20_SRM_FM3 TaxID=3240267 RepID=UPI003F94C11B